MIKNSKFIAHVGVPKSGTTLLQLHYFQRHPDICYLGKPYWNESVGFERSLAFHRAVDSVWQNDDLRFSPAHLAEDYESVIGSRLEADKVNVLSEEGLTNSGFVDRGLIADRLRDNLGVSKVLITIRNQFSAIPSLYYWYYARNIVGGTFNSWLSSLSKVDYYRGGLCDFPLRQYLYGELVKRYFNVFGKDKVLVLPIELMNHDLDEYCSKLSCFLGVDLDSTKSTEFWTRVENSSNKILDVKFQRLVHRVCALLGKYTRFCGGADRKGHHYYNEGFVKWINSVLKKYGPGVGAIDDDARSFISSYYHNDNLLLNQLTGLDTDSIGYP